MATTKHSTDLFYVIADANRRRLLDLLADGEKPVQKLVTHFKIEDIESELARIKQLDPPRISDQTITVSPFQLFQFSDPEGNILECFTRS